MVKRKRRHSDDRSGGGVVVLFRFRGKVHRGDGRGSALGFPTANLRLHHDIPDGIYVAFVRFQGVMHHALVFIGAPLTFGGTRRRAEVFVLGHEHNLYGRWMTVSLLYRLRDNKKFGSARALQRAMRKDLALAKTYFDGIG